MCVCVLVCVRVGGIYVCVRACVCMINVIGACLITWYVYEDSGLPTLACLCSDRIYCVLPTPLLGVRCVLHTLNLDVRCMSPTILRSVRCRLPTILLSVRCVLPTMLNADEIRQ